MPQPSLPPSAPPSVRRRLAALLYEAILLAGVVFFAGLAFTLATPRNGSASPNLLAAWIALVAGVYFIGFWTHSGQTLPMKTWRLRIESADGGPLTARHALVRYLLGWLWFLPPLALHPLAGCSTSATLALTGAWGVAWAAAARLHPARQFPHDRIARTRIVALPR